MGYEQQQQQQRNESSSAAAAAEIAIRSSSNDHDNSLQQSTKQLAAINSQRGTSDSSNDQLIRKATNLHSLLTESLNSQQHILSLIRTNSSPGISNSLINDLKNSTITMSNLYNSLEELLENVNNRDHRAIFSDLMNQAKYVMNRSEYLLASCQQGPEDNLHSDAPNGRGPAQTSSNIFNFNSTFNLDKQPLANSNAASNNTNNLIKENEILFTILDALEQSKLSTEQAIVQEKNAFSSSMNQLFDKTSHENIVKKLNYKRDQIIFNIQNLQEILQNWQLLINQHILQDIINFLIIALRKYLDTNCDHFPPDLSFTYKELNSALQQSKAARSAHKKLPNQANAIANNVNINNIGASLFNVNKSSSQPPEPRQQNHQKPASASSSDDHKLLADSIINGLIKPASHAINGDQNFAKFGYPADAVNITGDIANLSMQHTEAIQATNFANVPNSTIPFPSKFASTKVPDISSSIPTANSNSHHHHQAMHYQQNASQGSGKAVSDANFMALQLNSVSCMLPMAQDSSKIYTRLSTNKYCQSVPPYYPKNGFPEIFSLETFHKFPLELLFILFYRADATLGQKLAAKTLKNQSWRFHVDYKMWFQRHREPRMMTDEHESGSYIFFDFEKWLQRTKENFTFEYKYLEDKDL